jgi:uncharacterized membrane protein
MFEFHRSLLTHHRQINLIAALTLTTGLCVALLIVRLTYSQKPTHSWMLWNLFLALIPTICSVIAVNLKQKKTWLHLLQVVVWAGIWFVFLPNSLYLVTDIIHLGRRDNIPLWYDLAMFVSFAWAGSLLGLISLSMMQKLVHQLIGRMASWLFAIGALFISGFGLYLGRFLRWNSWDVITNPMSLTVNIYEVVSTPSALMHALAFSGIFSVIFTVIYLTLVAFTRFEQHNSQP